MEHRCNPISIYDFYKFLKGDYPRRQDHEPNTHNPIESWSSNQILSFFGFANDKKSLELNVPILVVRVRHSRPADEDLRYIAM